LIASLLLIFCQRQAIDSPGLLVNPGLIFLGGMMDERVTIFIDGANLLHGLSQDFNRIDVDFEKLVEKLLNNRQLSRIYYYTALPDQGRDPERYTKQQKFLAALQRKPYFRVVLGRLEPRGDTYVEKGVDISLAIDLLDLAYHNTYDTAIIISGDGDFSRAVEIVQRMGKHVENASTRSCLSNHLQQTCDKSLLLNAELLKNCWRK
jgi:uncharacterized LabA/DUF88 family protein